MSTSGRLRLLFGIFGTLRPHFCGRRIKYAYSRLPWTAESRILDIGGDTFFWNLAARLGLPAPRVTIVNLYSCPGAVPSNVNWIVADGTKLPFPDRSFDIAFSNSVIEHLGSWAAQEKMAAEIARVADHYFVQTPNKWFPIEPHYLTPFIHWLPPATRVRLTRNFTLWGWITRPSPEYCQLKVDEIQLLSRDEMRELFPKAHIVLERFCGIPKSILALDVIDQR
jgi:hypothetical protein